MEATQYLYFDFLELISKFSFELFLVSLLLFKLCCCTDGLFCHESLEPSLSSGILRELNLLLISSIAKQFKKFLCLNEL